MTEADASVIEDHGDAFLLATAGWESGPSGHHQPSAPEPLRPSTVQVPPSSGEGVGEPRPAQNTSKRAMAGWLDVSEELVNNSIIIDGHCILMSVVMQGIRSIQSGLNDVVQGFLKGFEVSQVILFSHKLDLVLSMPYL